MGRSCIAQFPVIWQSSRYWPSPQFDSRVALSMTPPIRGHILDLYSKGHSPWLFNSRCKSLPPWLCPLGAESKWLPPWLRPLGAVSDCSHERPRPHVKRGSWVFFFFPPILPFGWDSAPALSGPGLVRSIIVPCLANNILMGSFQSARVQ